MEKYKKPLLLKQNNDYHDFQSPKSYILNLSIFFYTFPAEKYKKYTNIKKYKKYK